MHSWKSGISRVVIWSFDNLYSETECWESLRFHKHQMPELLRELELHDSGEVDGRWRVRNALGTVQYVYDPMELLVIFLARMASPNTWTSRQLKFLGGRSRSAYTRGFYLVMEHIYNRFKRAIDDITRWADDANLFAASIHDAGHTILCAVHDLALTLALHTLPSVPPSLYMHMHMPCAMVGK